jgi:hypothetical protein
MGVKSGGWDQQTQRAKASVVAGRSRRAVSSTTAQLWPPMPAQCATAGCTGVAMLQYSSCACTIDIPGSVYTSDVKPGNRHIHIRQSIRSQQYTSSRGAYNLTYLESLAYSSAS